MKSLTRSLLSLVLLLNTSTLLAQDEDRLKAEGYRLEMPLQRQEMEDSRWKMEVEAQGCSFQEIEGSVINGIEYKDVDNQSSLLANNSVPISNLPSSISYLGVAPKLMMNPAIENAEEAIERFLTLEDFRRAVDQYPTATRFVIREEGGNTFIQPQESDAAAPGRNRSENMKITKALKAALEHEHSLETVKNLLPPNNSLSFTCPPLDAERLSTILHQSESLSFSDVSICEKNKEFELEPQKLQEVALQDQLIIASECHPSGIFISGERENEKATSTEVQKNVTKSAAILSPSYAYNRDMAFKIFVENYLIRPIIKNQQVIEYIEKVKQAFNKSGDSTLPNTASSWIYLAVNWINIAEEAERALKIRHEKVPCALHQQNIICNNAACNNRDQFTEYRAKIVIADCWGALEVARCWAKVAETSLLGATARIEGKTVGQWKDTARRAKDIFEWQEESTKASRAGNVEAADCWTKAAVALSEHKNQYIALSWTEAAKAASMGSEDALACWIQAAEALEKKEPLEKKEYRHEGSYITRRKIDASDTERQSTDQIQQTIEINTFNTEWQSIVQSIQQAIECRGEAKKAFQEGSEELADCWNKAAGAFINSQESVAKLWRAAAQAIQVEDRDAARCWREAAEFHSESNNDYSWAWQEVDRHVQKAIGYRREAIKAYQTGSVEAATYWIKAATALTEYVSPYVALSWAEVAKTASTGSGDAIKSWIQAAELFAKREDLKKNDSRGSNFNRWKEIDESDINWQSIVEFIEQAIECRGEAKKAFQEGSEELADCWNKAAGAFINSQESVAKLWRAAAQAIQVEDRDAIRCWREAAEFHSENYYFSSWKGVESRVQKAIEYRREATNASLEGNVVVACCWEKAVEALIIKESYKQAEGLVDLWKKRIETVLEYQKESAEAAHVGNSELAACWAKAATACTEPWYSVEKSWAEVARATQAGNRDEVEYWTKTAEALTKRQHGRSAKKINRYSDYEWKNIVSCIQMAFEYRAESIGASQSGNREAVGYWEKAANACAETQNKSLGNSWAEAAKSTQVGDWDAVACWSKTAEALAQKLVEAEKQNFEKEKIQEELSKAYRTDNKDAIEHWTKVQRSLSDDCLTSRSSTSWEDMKRCVQKAIEYRKNALQTAQAGHLEVADYWNRVIDVLTMTQNTGLADSWTVAACRAQQVVDYRAQSAQATQSGNVEEAHYWLKAVEVLAGTQRWNVSERNAIIVKANAERKRAWEKYDERDPKSPTITQAKEFEEEDRYVEKVSAFWKETAGFMHRSTECQVEAVKATAAKNKVVACHWAQAAEGVKAVVHDLIDFMESDDFGRKNTPHTRKHINILERYDMCSNYYEDSDKDGNIIDLAQRTAENVINYWLKAASERKPQVSERWKKAAQTAGEAVRCWTQAAKVTPRPKTQNSDLMNSYDENDNPWNEAAGSWNNAAEYWEEAAEGKNQSVHRWTKAAEAAEKAAFYWAQGGKALEFITESINSQESDWHNMAYRWDRASSCLASVKEQPKIAQNLETASLYWTNAATAATKEEAIDWTRAAESAEEIIKYKLDATRDTECANNVNASKRNRSQHRASAKDKLAEARRYETIVIEAKNAAEAKRQAYNVQTISATTNVSSSSLSEFNNQSSNLPSTENSIAASPTSCSSSASATLTTDSKATEQEQKSSAKGKKSKKK